MLSVIIPTCDRTSALRLCLNQLLPGVQQLEENSYEVIVTDDGKTNTSSLLIQENYPWVKWAPGPRSGPGSNRNSGAKLAQGKWLVFIDDDVIPDPHILREYLLAIEKNPSIKAFEGCILPDDKLLLKKEMAECPVNTTGGCFWSANICVDKNLFNEISGFDQNFKLAALEDEDIFKRLKLKTTVLFLPNCKVIHPVRFVSLKKKIKGMNAQFDNWIYYIKKHRLGNPRLRLAKSSFDYFKMTVKHASKLKLRLMLLHGLSSIYCLCLFATPRRL